MENKNKLDNWIENIEKDVWKQIKKIMKTKKIDEKESYLKVLFFYLNQMYFYLKQKEQQMKKE